ncbi:hypothetical protein GW17_00015510 [Ensete ventricosum]|nr:hypothetical protein GW17_00015510 [Ensete ventricosum]
MPSMPTPATLNLLIVASCEALLLCAKVLRMTTVGAAFACEASSPLASSSSPGLIVGNPILCLMSISFFLSDLCTFDSLLLLLYSSHSRRHPSPRLKLTSSTAMATAGPSSTEWHRSALLQWHKYELTLQSRQLCIFSSIADHTYYSPIYKAITSFQRSTTRPGTDSQTTSSLTMSLASANTSSMLLLPCSFRCRRATAPTAAATIAIWFI